SRKVADVFLADELQPAATRAESSAEPAPASYVPSAAELNAYAGEYHSDEVDASYDIEIRDRVLTIRSKKMRPQELRAISRDVFEFLLGRITFTRGDDTGVTELVVTTEEGIRQLSFAKTRRR